MGVLATLLPLPRNGIFAIILREGTRSKKMGGGGPGYPLPYTLYRRTGTWSVPERKDGERGDGGPGYPHTLPSTEEWDLGQH
jgi:hypothetical protein